jgi:hypothetical protein
MRGFPWLFVRPHRGGGAVALRAVFVALAFRQLPACSEADDPSDRERPQAGTGFAELSDVSGPDLPERKITAVGVEVRPFASQSEDSVYVTLELLDEAPCFDLTVMLCSVVEEGPFGIAASDDAPGDSTCAKPSARAVASTGCSTAEAIWEPEAGLVTLERHGDVAAVYLEAMMVGDGSFNVVAELAFDVTAAQDL